MRRTVVASLSALLFVAMPARGRAWPPAQQFPGSVPGIAWARIPAGTFQMGCVPADTRCDPDEAPRHSVTLSRPFEMMTSEVTVEAFQLVTKDVDPQPPWSTTPGHPVVIVPWTEAQAFCEAIGGRLPTEAEWEYAARGGRADTIYPWGNNEPSDRPGDPNGASFEGDGARAVKSFGANGYGLHDMMGNVWEWVADWSGPYAVDAVTDPKGPATGVTRAVRGGSYGDDSRNLRVSNRSGNRPRNVNFNIGFRCARDL